MAIRMHFPRRGVVAALSAALFVFLLGARDAAAEPDPAEIVRGAMAYVAGLDAKSFDMVLSQQTVVRGTEHNSSMNAEMVLRGEKDFFVQVTAPSQEAAIVSDGEKMFIHLITDKQYIERTPPPNRTELVGMVAAGSMQKGSKWLARFLHNDPTLMTDASSVTYAGLDDVDGAQCHRINLAYPGADTELWIDAGAAPVLRRMQMDLGKTVTAGSSPVIMLITFDVSDWEPNPVLAADRFAFTPPEGVTLYKPGNPGERADPLLGKPAPNFSLELLGGGSMELAKHKDKDVVILEFWATWCGPCRVGMPAVARVAKAYAGKGVVLYTVNSSDGPEKARSFLSQMELDVPVAMDTKTEAARLYRADSIPRTVIIGKDGTVQAVHRGFFPGIETEMSSQIDTLLAGKSLAGAEG